MSKFLRFCNFKAGYLFLRIRLVEISIKEKSSALWILDMEELEFYNTNRFLKSYKMAVCILNWFQEIFDICACSFKIFTDTNCYTSQSYIYLIHTKPIVYFEVQ